MSFPHGISTIPGTDIIPGRVTILTKVETNAARDWYLKKFKSRERYVTIPAAYAATTSGRNDTILVTPQSHVWTAALTWANSNTHLIGMQPGRIANRSRFGHSGYTMANFLTLSGQNCLFKNLYWMHGSSEGAASDITLATITGSRNVFMNCHFGGPNDVTQAASANYAQMVISGSQNQFINCTWGGFNLALRGSASTILKFTGTGIGNLFDNCTFYSRTVATTPYWINQAQTNVSFNNVAHFKNTQFINTPGTLGTGDDIAKAILFATDPDTTGRYFSFDANSHFSHTTKLFSTGHETGVMLPQSGETNSKLGIMIDAA